MTTTWQATHSAGETLIGRAKIITWRKGDGRYEMMYLEMSRDSVHGGDGWAFSNCLWAPTKKRGRGDRWPFWTMVRSVRANDIILHLKGVHPNANFVGYSQASGDGVETDERPPDPGEWSYAQTFFRADLDGYAPFHEPINLAGLFVSRRSWLERYFERNRTGNTIGKHIFLVQQASRLQCLNGAYLSEVDEDLFTALFGETVAVEHFISMAPQVTIETGVQLLLIKGRLGQRTFADAIKELYGYRCCFPSCVITDPRFLVGSHIARWSDNVELRGNLGNGMCLCLMHDKAFELGLFTIDERFRVFTAFNKLGIKAGSDFCDLQKQHGKHMRLARIPPTADALLEHWERTGIYPV